MNQFKKSFRGYRIAEVDERLYELESQLKASEARCELLEKQLNESKLSEKQLNEARQEADRAQAHLEDRNAEIRKLKDSYEQLRLEQTEKQTQAESIGRVYLKAFESGREIAMAPAPHVEEFLQDVEDAAAKSGLELSGAKRDFANASDKMAAIIAEIHRLAEFLNHRFEELATGVENMDNVYMQFDRVKDATKADIERIRRNYEQVISEYKDTPSSYPAKLNPAAKYQPGETASASGKDDFSSAIPGKPLSQVEQEFSSASASAATMVIIDPTVSAKAASKDAFDSRSSVPEAPLLSDNAPSDNGTSGDDNTAAPVQPAVVSSDEAEQKGKLDEKNSAPTAADTSADFRDGKNSDTEDAPSQVNTAADADQEPSKEKMRGQNILNLLNKYQKK